MSATNVKPSQRIPVFIKITPRKSGEYLLAGYVENHFLCSKWPDEECPNGAIIQILPWLI